MASGGGQPTEEVPVLVEGPLLRLKKHRGALQGAWKQGCVCPGWQCACAVVVVLVTVVCLGCGCVSPVMGLFRYFTAKSRGWGGTLTRSDKKGCVVERRRGARCTWRWVT